MSSTSDTCRLAIRRLHREKSAAYRDAWKRRGEVISIVANIARKVDRLEHASDGAPGLRDENVMDTAIDLLIYCIKYKTFLADMDESVATLIFKKPTSRPYSDGWEGFESALDTVDLAAVDNSTARIDEASCGVVVRFGDLVACFSGVTAVYAPSIRLDKVDLVIGATVNLVGALRRVDDARFRQFVDRLCADDAK